MRSEESMVTMMVRDIYNTVQPRNSPMKREAASLRAVAVEIFLIFAIMAIAAAGTSLSAWSVVAWLFYLFGPVIIAVCGLVFVIRHIRTHSSGAAIVMLFAMLASLYLCTILSKFPGS